MAEKVKSGKEILDDFFKDLKDIKILDIDIVNMLVRLYDNDNLTDTNVKNELQKLREQDVNKD
jgi:hypothetical protein